MRKLAPFSIHSLAWGQSACVTQWMLALLSPSPLLLPVTHLIRNLIMLGRPYWQWDAAAAAPH